MKKNNLINTLSPTQQYAIRRWFIISLLLLIGTTITIVIIEIPQLYALQSIRKENAILTTQTESFNDVINQQHKLQKEEQQCKEKEEAINKYEQELNNLIDNFSTIIDTSMPSCSIESLQIKTEHIELVARCAQIPQAINLIEQLMESKKFHDLKLGSLQQTEQQPSFLFTVQGKR